MAVDRALVLAGGGGLRLWPWAGPARPKPSLPLGGGGRTLLGATLERLAGVLAPDRIALLAPEGVADALARREPRARRLERLVEPSARDTGPALAWAMARLAAGGADPIVAVLPADHRIDDESAFRHALDRAAELAQEGWLVTLGVRPTEPATRYGHIVPGEPIGTCGHRAARFEEKPAAARAEELMRAGALWNAGIFVWRAAVVLDRLERTAPEVARAARAAAERGDRRGWDRLEPISIDYALMERAERVGVVPLEAGWSDVGDWSAVEPIVASGDVPGARRLAPAGDASGCRVLWVGRPSETRARAVLLGERPELVVLGPEGVLVAERARLADLKAALEDGPRRNA